MGKKLQWIALHEFLAHLSDNVHWIGRGFSDVDDHNIFGPWQMHLRDIDPTIWIRKKAGEKDTYYNEETTWWQTYKFPLEGVDDLPLKLEFLWSESVVPNFCELLQLSEDSNHSKWTALRGFWMQQQRSGDDLTPDLEAWFRVNSILVKNSDFAKLKKGIVGKNRYAIRTGKC